MAPVSSAIGWDPFDMKRIVCAILGRAYVTVNSQPGHRHTSASALYFSPPKARPGFLRGG
jgi:hypothetical protein